MKRQILQDISEFMRVLQTIILHFIERTQEKYHNNGLRRKNKKLPLKRDLFSGSFNTVKLATSFQGLV